MSPLMKNKNKTNSTSFNCLVVILESQHSRTVEKNFLCVCVCVVLWVRGSWCEAGSYKTEASGAIVCNSNLTRALLTAQSCLTPNC